ncbi:Hypothetical_protein [Hexamita inflata]|uniref:Hypothetical_protein n=1 Tax=Hexamita inflata TaxID=28002 RepID=A0AA86UZA8_9EUKA|nr:Hypothetical protein HINF_LOCUS58036 [Hexamita inflata]
MNIISRPNCQLKVNSMLNILTPASESTDITDLLVNLSLTSSSGNIALITNINGILNISGYQVLGYYVSTGTVAMIGINLNSETANVNKLSFQPLMYYVGNGSSFLFGNAVTTIDKIVITNVAFIMGNSTNYLLQGSIAATYSNYYLFGGIIAQINCASLLSVNNVISDSYQTISSSYVRHSGFLVGYVYSKANSIIINNICLQQNMTSTTQVFNYFGLIGSNYGNTSMQNASIIFAAQVAAYSHCFGIIGIQWQSSLYAEVINLRTSISYSFSQGTCVGSIFGYLHSNTNNSIQNTTVFGGNISASGSSFVGGFCGFQDISSTVTIFNSSISITNISGSTNVAGFVGQCQILNIINSKILLVYLSCSSSVGIVSSNGGTFQISGSSSTQNYINGVKQSDCAILSNFWSAVGC